MSSMIDPSRLSPGAAADAANADAIEDRIVQRGNYFSEGTYVFTDVKTGVSRNRAGTRICCLTNDFLLGFYRAIVDECGPAAGTVFQSCGRRWGSAFARRFELELSAFYGISLTDAPMSIYHACLSEGFSHHGWGRLQLDLTHHEHGLVVVIIENAIMASLLGASDTPTDSLLAGTISGFFSHFAGQELECVQTQCLAMGSPDSRFVVGLPNRLAKAVALVANNVPHDQILAQLAATQG